VVLSAAVTSKGGRVLLARQFQDIPRLRIEGLLAAFPKLLGGSDKQHTYLETDSVRYLYHPLEHCFVLLVTNRASNILEDLETMQLLVKVTTDFCRVGDEEDIIAKAFDLTFAFDEVVNTAGYREKITMYQINQFLEMDSQDEKLFEMIEKSKRREAMEEAKRRQHQIEQERRDARSEPKFSHEPHVTSYHPTPVPTPTPTTSHPNSPKPQRRGMVLAPVGKKNEFLEKLNSEIASTTQPQRTQPQQPQPQQPPPESNVPQRQVHYICEEKVNATLIHEGSVSVEVKGDLVVLVNDPKCGRILTIVNKPTNPSIQYKTHPNIDKNRFTKESVLVLKNPNRPLPSGTPLGVLKYRMTSAREEDLPLSVTCWPSDAGDGTTICNLEVELQQKHMQINGVEVYIPSPVPPSVEGAEGMCRYGDGVLAWKIPTLNAASPSASLEFRVQYRGDAAAFFPIRVGFVSSSILSNLQVARVCLIDGNNEVPYSVESRIEVEAFDLVYPQN